MFLQKKFKIHSIYILYKKQINNNNNNNKYQQYILL